MSSADRLRDARASGSQRGPLRRHFTHKSRGGRTNGLSRKRLAQASQASGDNKDVLAVHAEGSVNAARIARLEELLRSAPIVDREFDGLVSVGCTVHVAGEEVKIRARTGRLVSTKIDD
jgi:transcription elongation GreA/GreB family factor